MPFALVFDSQAEQDRHDALRDGLIWAEMDEAANRINVWWPRALNTYDLTIPDTKGAMGDKLKAIGGKGITNSGGWIPRSITHCRQLRKQYGELLEVSEELDDWAAAEIERLGSIENLSSAAADAELCPEFAAESPALARVIHPYQRAGIAFLARTKRALLADQPGLGKTAQTIGAMIEAGIEGDILVMAPTAAVAITWPDELRTWVPQDEVIQVMGPGPKRHKILGENLQYEPEGKRRWFIVNLEMGRAQWVKPRKVFRKPKNDKSAPERWVTEPGWWDFSYPEFVQGFEFTNVTEEWKRDIDLDSGKYFRKKKVTSKEVVHVPAPQWAAVVVDESHRCLIAHTHHLQGCTQIRAGIAQIPVVEGGLKIALSGTPMRGKPENLWGTLNWLYPERYTAYWTWAKQWFDVWGEEGKEQLGGLNEATTSEFYKDIAPIVLRRTKKEVRAELPDKLYAGTPLPDIDGNITDDSPVGHWLTMSPKQAKAYEDMRDMAETQLDSGILVANGVLAELTRLKQFATCFGDIEEKPTSAGDVDYIFRPKLPSAKFDWLVEFLDDLGINRHASMEPDEEDEVRKVVVASQFTSVLDLYDAELQKKGIKTLKITGKVSQAQRKVAAHTWQSAGGPRVFLLNTAAGGVSLTLDQADDLVFLDETWIPDDQEQVEDRIHRVSRMHQVTIHYLRTLGTVEENIALVTGSRERTTKRLLDGERGVSFAKRLLTPINRPR